MICESFEKPIFYFFSSQVPSLLYYSHISTLLISLVIGFSQNLMNISNVDIYHIKYQSFGFYVWEISPIPYIKIFTIKMKIINLLVK